MTKKTESAVGRASEKQVDEALSEQWGDSLGARRVLAAEVRALREELKNAKHLAPPTENKDEREHARQVAREMCADETDETYEQANYRYILRERAAAGKAEYERGRLHASADEWEGLQRKLTELAADRDMQAQSANERGQELRKLQSQHKRLTAAASDLCVWVELETNSTAKTMRLRAIIDAALAETLPETEGT